MHMPLTVEGMQNECQYGCIFITAITTLNKEQYHNTGQLNPPFIFLSCLRFTIIFRFSVGPPLLMEALWQHNRYPVIRVSLSMNERLWRHLYAALDVLLLKTLQGAACHSLRFCVTMLAVLITEPWPGTTYFGDVGVASRGKQIVLVASQVVSPKHDELRPAVSKELYSYRGINCLEYRVTQLSDTIILSKHNGDVSSEKKDIVSVASQSVCFMRICCVPSAARVWVAAKDMGIQNVKQCERSYTV
jgi:hypothetical protein